MLAEEVSHPSCIDRPEKIDRLVFLIDVGRRVWDPGTATDLYAFCDALGVLRLAEAAVMPYLKRRGTTGGRYARPRRFSSE